MGASAPISWMRGFFGAAGAVSPAFCAAGPFLSFAGAFVVKGFAENMSMLLVSVVISAPPFTLPSWLSSEAVLAIAGAPCCCWASAPTSACPTGAPLPSMKNSTGMSESSPRPPL